SFGCMAIFPGYLRIDLLVGCRVMRAAEAARPSEFLGSVARSMTKPAPFRVAIPVSRFQMNLDAARAPILSARANDRLRLPSDGEPAFIDSEPDENVSQLLRALPSHTRPFGHDFSAVEQRLSLIASNFETGVRGDGVLDELNEPSHVGAGSTVAVERVVDGLSLRLPWRSLW